MKVVSSLGRLLLLTTVVHLPLGLLHINEASIVVVSSSPVSLVLESSSPLTWAMAWGAGLSKSGANVVKPSDAVMVKQETSVLNGLMVDFFIAFVAAWWCAGLVVRNWVYSNWSFLLECL